MQVLVNIDVPDMEAAVAFYTAAFPLTVGRRFDGQFVELLGAPVPIYLLECASGTPAAADARRDYTRHWTPVHLDFAVTDIEAATEKALSAGAKQETATRDTAYGRIATFADPFGHGFCLIQFNEGGYDNLRTKPAALSAR